MDESKLSPKEQVEYMLQRAKILEEQKQQKQKEEKEKFIPVVAVEEQHLPDLLTPVTSLNLFEDEIDTEQTILSKFKVDEDAYKGVNITPEKVKKVKKSLGRMTTGVAAAVPLNCRAEHCSYSSTCLTGDTLILTSTFKEVPLKDIKIGDTVEVAGKTAKVSNFFDQGVQETVIVKYDGGQIECTPNHRLAVFDTLT